MTNWQYLPQMPQMYQRQEVIRVNGENGARALNLPPNSSALVLDEHEPLVWLCQTDGAGYKTVSAYRITPVQNETPVSVKELAARIEKLEGLLNEQSYSGRDAAEERNSGGSKSNKKQNAGTGD